MSQHDFNIANQGFPATRADINNAFQAIASNSSGPTAPSTTYANMWWYDETNNKMYLRNEADSAWIEVATIDQTNNEWQITTGQISAVDVDGISFKTDDGTTRVKIDDSGNLLVGTTDTLPNVNNVEGIALSAGSYGGFLAVSRDGDTPMGINRKTSDGSLLDFRKDGSTVGSIGNNGGYLYIGSPQGTDAYIGMGSSQVYPATSTGGYRDAAIDLGGDNERFKDLYLSGGVYLGGTGVANKLDDYEEGTWTPTFSASSGSFTTVSTTYAVYTKVGRQVILETKFVLTTIGTASGSITVGGQPFNIKSGQGNHPILVRVANTGALGKGQIANQMSSITGYDGTSIISSGSTIVITAIYNTT